MKVKIPIDIREFEWKIELLFTIRQGAGILLAIIIYFFIDKLLLLMRIEREVFYLYKYSIMLIPLGFGFFYRNGMKFEKYFFYVIKNLIVQNKYYPDKEGDF